MKPAHLDAGREEVELLTDRTSCSERLDRVGDGEEVDLGVGARGKQAAELLVGVPAMAQSVWWTTRTALGPHRTGSGEGAQHVAP